MKPASVYRSASGFNGRWRGNSRVKAQRSAWRPNVFVLLLRRWRPLKLSDLIRENFFAIKGVYAPAQRIIRQAYEMKKC